MSEEGKKNMLDNCEFYYIQVGSRLFDSHNSMMIENHWGFSAVPLLFMAVFAEWKVIENIFTELKR